jgi:ABC-type transporter Mla MlaB component
VASPSIQAPVESAKLALTGSCCIDGLGPHHEQLLRALEDGAAVELDLTEITRMDTAGLQLLLVFVSSMKREGRGVRVLGASETVKQCATSAGVTELLGL